MLPLIAAGLSALPGIFKGVTGLIGQSEYGKMKRPDFEIPKGVTDAENTYKYLAGQDMPGSAAYEQKILGNQESLLNRLENNTESGASLLGSVPNIVAKTNENLSDLTTQGAEFRNKNAANLANFEGSTMANWQGKKKEWESYQPYLNDQEAKQRANLNTYEGLSDAIGGGFKAFSGASLLKNQTDNMNAQSASWDTYLKSLGTKGKTIASPVVGNSTETPDYLKQLGIDFSLPSDGKNPPLKTQIPFLPSVYDNKSPFKTKQDEYNYLKDILPKLLQNR